ncbi:hypothetical protein J6590_093338, partial [Homalodisca vitripennis]
VQAETSGTGIPSGTCQPKLGRAPYPSSPGPDVISFNRVGNSRTTQARTWQQKSPTFLIHTTVCFGRASSHQLSSATPSQSVAVQALPTNNSTIHDRIGDVSGTSSGYERSPTFKRQSKTSPYGLYIEVSYR